MRMLVIGGTRFVGRHLVESALSSGHEVTLLHRGQTGRDLFPDAEHLLADRDGDLGLLAGREFDATVDVCGYLPGQVRALADALGGHDSHGGHHVFVSSVSAYVDPPAPGADESAPLVELDDPDVDEVTNETYGGLKVACERAAAEAYGPSGLAIVRPTYVIGPYDPTGRFTWWVDRMSRGGRVLAPGPQDGPMQVIDARDMADWMVRLAADRVSGAFHAVSPAPPFGFADLLEATRTAVSPDDTSLVWADPTWLVDHGVDGMAMPLWSEGAREYALAMDPAAATATGLSPRPLVETIRDTWAWMSDGHGESSVLRPEWGLSSEREEQLLAELG